jgi:NitT/TauT family transport system permease protein
MNTYIAPSDDRGFLGWKRLIPLAKPRAERAGTAPLSIAGYGKKIAAHLLMLTVIGAAWQYTSDHFVADQMLLTGPIEVIQRLWTWLIDGTIAVNLAYTLGALIGGFIIGTVIAQVTAILLTEWPRVGQFLEPYIMALSAIPNIAFVPMFIVWFGIGIETKILICLKATFFVVFVNSYSGLRNTDAHLLEMARILKASRWQRLWHVKLMASVPFFLAGAKLAVPRALIAVVVAEFLASNKGIGYLIVRNAQLLDTAAVFAGTIVLTVIVYALIGLTTSIENRLLRWKPRERQ